MIKWCTILVSGFADCREVGIAHVFRFLGGSAVPGGLAKCPNWKAPKRNASTSMLEGSPYPKKDEPIWFGHGGFSGFPSDTSRKGKRDSDLSLGSFWLPLPQNEAGRLPGCLGVLGCSSFFRLDLPKKMDFFGGFSCWWPCKTTNKKGGTEAQEKMSQPLRENHLRVASGFGCSLLLVVF